ncbi:MAG: Calx-beta domain-containing protein, partial [Actinomycetota bacterium]
ESFNVAIESASGGASVTFPSEAAVTIVDDDGPARLSMLTPAEEIFENRGPLELTIVRSGEATSAVSVTFTTADGTAIAGEDYTTADGTLTFGAGERLKRVRLSPLNDPDPEGSETFDFIISSPAGAEITEPSKTTVTIADDEDASSDVEPPITAFHQPLHNKTYGARQARDILIFADDEASGVRSVDFALQMRMRSGVCRWYDRQEKTFTRGSCSKRVWVRLQPGTDVTVHSLPDVFRSSTGGKRVRFYKAFSRGRDELGNVETSFEYARNLSRFDIR